MKTPAELYQGGKMNFCARQNTLKRVILSGMDVNKMIAELRQEREQIEEAILSLERLARGQGKRRGRPPAWLKAAQGEPVSAAPKRRGRPPGSKNKPKEDAAG
ncbi:MAG: hypothetical protein IT170_10240 [Bryobacterales bacterium]|nr:hypothetical protein [Bryobacterales bacterium]